MKDAIGVFFIEIRKRYWQIVSQCMKNQIAPNPAAEACEAIILEEDLYRECRAVGVPNTKICIKSDN
jgi:hypothetical protein